ncbi:MAG: hypothetical protein V4507_12060 [Verrucomicrobiota bacterium]
MNRVFPFLFVIIISLISLSAESRIQISDSVALKIGNKIWKNECNGTINGLTSWNKGENFASLGICHFIWYPVSETKVFDESFPKLLTFLESNRVTLPFWLQKNPPCPWPNQAEFQKAVANPQDERMIELKKLLQETIPLQARFAIVRLQNALPLMLEKTEEKNRANVTQQFYRIAEIPAGLYALVDYVNFKGEGVKETERYNQQGWGLLQVLEQLHGAEAPGALFEFSRAAEFVLTRRVKNAPPERHEERWLPGWINRCKTYANYNLD